MNIFASSVLALVTLGASSAHADVDAKAGVRELGGYMKHHSHAPLPPKQMYKEIIYLEKNCRDEVYIPSDDAIDIDIPSFLPGDMISFTCELYESAITYGTYGANKVGDTYYGCKIIGRGTAIIDGQEVSVPVTDCTITDYIGEQGDVPIGEEYLRNEGFTLKLLPNVRNILDGEDIEFPSVSFATVGGVGVAKGARGDLELVYDEYLGQFVHKYTVEVWHLDQKLPLHKYH